MNAGGFLVESDIEKPGVGNGLSSFRNASDCETLEAPGLSILSNARMTRVGVVDGFKTLKGCRFSWTP